MKIILRKPRQTWYSPYLFLEKIFFWKDLYGKDEKFGDKWSDRLMPISAFLQKFLEFFKRKDKIRIDDWDVWSLDHSLGLIILPCLLKIKEDKNGIPYVENEDVPETLTTTGGDYNRLALKWHYVLDEMIFAFSMINTDYEKQFRSGVSDIEFKDLENGVVELVRTEKDTFKIDFEGLKKVDDRIKNGLTLFGKYYRSLWT